MCSNIEHGKRKELTKEIGNLRLRPGLFTQEEKNGWKIDWQPSGSETGYEA
jgi:hypothetical protein